MIAQRGKRYREQWRIYNYSREKNIAPKIITESDVAVATAIDWNMSLPPLSSWRRQYFKSYLI